MTPANNPPSRIKSIRRVRLSLLAAVALILLAPRAGSAYDNDTHFWLTYYLAREVGYTNTQATQIASANVGVDFDKDTEPLLPSFDSPWDVFQILAHHQNTRDLLHALPLTAKVRDHEWWNPLRLEPGSEQDKEAKAWVVEEKRKLWEETLNERAENGRANPGVFLHYLQDIFSHEGFTSHIGHVGYYYADFLDSDRAKAELMALATLRYLIVYREALSGEKLETKDVPDPESLLLKDRFSDAQMDKIKRVVKELCEVNPALESTYPNELVEHWKRLDEKTRRAYHLPAGPYGYLRKLWRIKKRTPMPDSAKAREVVRRALGMRERDLPYIWLYDFNSNADPVATHAEEVLVYVPYKTEKCVFTWDDEKKNTRRRRIIIDSKRQCLAFSLKPQNPETDPFDCD